VPQWEAGIISSGTKVPVPPTGVPDGCYNKLPKRLGSEEERDIARTRKQSEPCYIPAPFSVLWRSKRAWPHREAVYCLARQRVNQVLRVVNRIRQFRARSGPEHPVHRMERKSFGTISQDSHWGSRWRYLSRHAAEACTPDRDNPVELSGPQAKRAAARARLCNRNVTGIFRIGPSPGGVPYDRRILIAIVRFNAANSHDLALLGLKDGCDFRAGGCALGRIVRYIGLETGRARRTGPASTTRTWVPSNAGRMRRASGRFSESRMTPARPGDRHGWIRDAFSSTRASFGVRAI
jgi:hypothetical protein